MTALYIQGIFLLFMRIASFVAFLPLTGGNRLPKTVKIGLAVALTFLWLGQFALPASTLFISSVTQDWFYFSWLVSREVLLGASSGWLLGLIFVPLRIAGSYISQEMGLTMATLTSASGDSNSNVISEVFDGLAVLAFFAMNGHHLFFYGLHLSLQRFPLGNVWNLSSHQAVLAHLSQVIHAGMKLAAPVALVLMATTVGLLFMMRQTPQFNLFNFGMPVRLLAGLIALVVLIPDVLFQFGYLIRLWFENLSRIGMMCPT